jgi:tRNA 2-thiouridine synthesizing protein A
MAAVARILDATGLKCPMPVLRARRALKEMASGEVLEVLADDPAAAKDFPAFCTMSGDTLEATGKATDTTGSSDPAVLFFRIRKT